MNYKEWLHPDFWWLYEQAKTEEKRTDILCRCGDTYASASFRFSLAWGRFTNAIRKIFDE